MIRTRTRGCIALVATLLSALIVLAGCGDGGDSGGSAASSSADSMRTFIAQNGTVQVPRNPQRIVALGNAVAPLIDLGSKPVGITESQFFIDATTWFTPGKVAVYRAARNVGQGKNVDIEAIAALQPDLIVAAAPPGPLKQIWAPLESRLKSIAPTVLITNGDDWKAVDAQFGDLAGKGDEVTRQKTEYDALVAGLKSDFAEKISARNFVFLNRYANTPDAQVTKQSSGKYAAKYATEVGLKIDSCADRAIECPLSYEQLSGIRSDATIIYPLGPDGKVTAEFAPTLESNVWKALPQVTSGRALGVKYPSALSGYHQGILNLTGLREVLQAMPG